MNSWKRELAISIAYFVAGAAVMTAGVRLSLSAAREMREIHEHAA